MNESMLSKLETVSRSGLSRDQKRKLGILPMQVLSDARKLHADGIITKDMTAEEMAFVLIAEKMDDAKVGINWQEIIDSLPAILAFLTQLFEIISKFFL